MSLSRAFLALLAILFAPLASSDTPLQVFVHAEVFDSSDSDQIDYELGLGALQKIGGRWRFKHSERISGSLQRSTWQLMEGYTAEEAFEWYYEQLNQSAQLLFECAGRSCGRSAQWAHRVFQQRVLYGHDDRQRYAVWRSEIDGERITWVLYAVDRANRRHFVHLDRLTEALDSATELQQ